MPIPRSSKQDGQWESRPIGFGLSHNRRRYPDGSRLKKTAGLLAKLALVCFLFGAVVVAGAYIWFSKDLPSPDKLLLRSLPQSTKIYDRTGENILYEVHGEQRRTLVKLDDIPEHVKQATIAIEDKDFYHHKGISLWGIFRGLVIQPLRGKGAQGGSTLTQQFIKNAVLTPERTVQRKIREWILSYRIESKYSKDEILQMYLNEIPYGSTAYGIESASRMYFDKSVGDLTVAEGALLAALPQAPSRYSPYGNNTDILEGRQHLALDVMAELGYVTEEEARRAKEENALENVVPSKADITAPHFVMYVKDLLTKKYGSRMVEEGGLKIYTTLDLEKQKIAEGAVKWGADRNAENYGASNAALVSTDPKTGEILAMVGSKDYFDAEIDGNVNVAIRPRQPGSSFKPMVYATAFKKGYTPETVLFDTLTSFGPQGPDEEEYIPHNYDDKEFGPVTIRKALAGSLNIPAVKAIYLAGIRNVLDLADRMGYTTFADRSRYGLSLVLGGGEVKLLDHVIAYGVFATEGLGQPGVAILKVEDKEGNVLEEHRHREGKRILDAEIARQISDILSDNDARKYVFGENSALVLEGRPAAAKTGTTNDYRDGWTVGYTPSMVAGVWVGNNDNSAMKGKAAGGNVAAPIWNRYMREALRGKNFEGFAKPQKTETAKPILIGQAEGETMVKIDRASGKLATDLTPETFIEERPFKQVHNILHYVNKDDPQGLSPLDPTVDPQYEYWEEAVRKWVKENEYSAEGPPEEYDDLHVEANRPVVSIEYPRHNGVHAGVIFEARVSARAPRGVSRVDYYIDGKLVDSVKEYPHDLKVFASDFESGEHTLTAKAYDDIDNEGKDKVKVRFILSGDRKMIYWLSPEGGSLAFRKNFPLELSALVPKPGQVSRVKFYYLNEAQFQPSLIGMVTDPQSPRASVSWAIPPASGDYKLYVEMIDEGGSIARSDYLELEIK